MRLKRIFDATPGPKQGLTAEQWPAEVENPTTGKMEPVDRSGKSKQSGESEGSEQGEIKDEADEQTKVKLYRQLKRFVPDMLKSLYPSYLKEGGTTDDAVSQIYYYVTRPRTSAEDIEKLKAEDAEAGVEHSDKWYRYEQTKYPKTSQLDWFDGEKSTIEGFSHTVAKQGIIRMMKADRSLVRGEDGAYRKIAQFSSMDTDTDDEESINPTRAEAESKASSSQSQFDMGEWVRRLSTMSEGAREGAISRIKDLLASGQLEPSIQGNLRKLVKAFEKKPTLNSDGSQRAEWGSGNWRGSMALDKKVAEGGFPFAVEPRVVRASDHSSKLKFTFGSRKEAEAEAEKHNGEMEQKGWKFVKVQGTSILYTWNGE